MKEGRKDDAGMKDGRKEGRTTAEGRCATVEGNVYIHTHIYRYLSYMHRCIHLSLFLYTARDSDSGGG